MHAVGAAFDFEGTTVDLEKDRHGAHLEAAASFGLAIDNAFAVASLPHFIGGPDEKVAEDIYNLATAQLSASPLTMPQGEFVAEFLRRDRILFESRLAVAEISPREGAPEMISWLAERKVPVALGSLTREAQGHLILQRSGLGAAFGKRVVFREHVSAVKPAPEVYERTAALMEVSPTRQIVFEDSPRGITAAHSAGSSPIGMPVVLEDSALRALAASGPLRIFRDWRDPELREYVTQLLERLSQDCAASRPSRDL